MLQWVAVPTVTNDKCNKAWILNNPIYYTYVIMDFITSSMICAGGGGKGACFGDSGGPLICQEGGKAVLTGVTSLVRPGCDSTFPTVFARQTAVLEWVKANMVCTRPSMYLFHGNVFFYF